MADFSFEQQMSTDVSRLLIKPDLADEDEAYRSIRYNTPQFTQGNKFVNQAKFISRVASRQESDTDEPQ